MKHVNVIFFILVSCLLSSILNKLFDNKQSASKTITFFLSLGIVYLVFSTFFKKKYPLKDAKGMVIKGNMKLRSIKTNQDYFDGLQSSMLLLLLLFVGIGIYSLYKYFEYNKFNSIRGFIAVWFILLVLFLVFGLSSYYSLFDQIKFNK